MQLRNQSVSMATLRDSLETMNLINLPCSFSIFLTSWAWSVLYCKHTASSVTFIQRFPSQWRYFSTTLTFIGSVKYSFSAALANPSHI
uniref:Uncharacterized protein n=1 Tax=Anguilla anguilla TaxID=7936 RepID=A0A0E9WK08_ANGAN